MQSRSQPNLQQSLSPLGSQRKRAAINGAQYTQIEVTPFAKGVPGKAKLLCAKDRHGTYTRGDTVAEVMVTPTGDTTGLRIRLATPHGPGANPTAFRPTTLMERVSEAIETAPEALTQRGVLDRVAGKSVNVITARDILINEGYVRTKTGPNNSTLHESVKPYRQVNDPLSDYFLAGGSLLPVSDSLSKERGRESPLPPIGESVRESPGITGNNREITPKSEGITQHGFSLDSGSSDSPVIPTQKTPKKGDCPTCNFPLSGRPGSRKCEPDHDELPGSVKP